MSQTVEPRTPHEREMRGGEPPWSNAVPAPPRARVEQDLACDVLVVGAGITGSLIAQHLTERGREVCVVDRDLPGYVSTAASTAMLQWEIDCSLTELGEAYGFERAARLYRKSLGAARGLADLVKRLRLDCAFRERSSLYLAGFESDPSALLREHALRDRAGLPGVYLDYLTLKREFGFDRPGALLSQGCAEADPLALSRGLLGLAVRQGAKLFAGAAVAFESDARRVYVRLDDEGCIDARHVVLATGYDMPEIVRCAAHSVSSSWALATRPQPEGSLWRERALIWEDSHPYLYARTMLDGRIIVGGEDEAGVGDPQQRDARTPAKTAALQAKLVALWPDADPSADFAWSGAFGETADGLPLIGPAPGHARVFAAYGYGGNGITFSFLASRMIAGLLVGVSEEDGDAFALDRDIPQI